MDTQLIAHDKEVYDIAWGGVGVFASVSADGSVRVFDLRQAALYPPTRESLIGQLPALPRMPTNVLSKFVFCFLGEFHTIDRGRSKCKSHGAIFWVLCPWGLRPLNCSKMSASSLWSTVRAAQIITHSDFVECRAGDQRPCRMTHKMLM